MFVHHTNITSFILQDISGHWAEPNIQYLVDEGVLIGYPDQTFHPNSPITRAEAAIIISRLQKSKQETSHTAKTLLDNYRDHEEIPSWAKEAIVEVTESHIMTGYKDDTFKPNHYVSRHEAYQIIHNWKPQPIQEEKAGERYITRAEFCTLILNS